MVESYTFSIFPKTHHTEAEIGFIALLNKIKIHQPVTDLMNQEGSQTRIADGNPNHISGDGNLFS